MYMWIIVIGSAIWVYVDAKKIGVRKGLISGMFDIGAGTWCAATLLLWIVVFPAYLIKRGALKAAVAAQAGPGAAPGATVAAQGGAIESLEKLANLRDRGVLTETEFDQKKRQLLAQ
jgi:hypothetical protein